MRNFLPLLAGAALLAMVSATGCANQAGTSDETLYKRVPGKIHRTQFPEGHQDQGGCYYDEKEDVYYCSK